MFEFTITTEHFVLPSRASLEHPRLQHFATSQYVVKAANFGHQVHRLPAAAAAPAAAHADVGFKI